MLSQALYMIVKDHSWLEEK